MAQLCNRKVESDLDELDLGRSVSVFAALFCSRVKELGLILLLHSLDDYSNYIYSLLSALCFFVLLRSTLYHGGTLFCFDANVSQTLVSSVVTRCCHVFIFLKLSTLLLLLVTPKTSTSSWWSSPESYPSFFLFKTLWSLPPESHFVESEPSPSSSSPSSSFSFPCVVWGKGEEPPLCARSTIFVWNCNKSPSQSLH